MRCASIHRKLGTHISKVKSLSMDGWSNEQVENMKKVGNVTSNKIYNPENKKPPVPVDADEADGAMERFIRAKYTTSPTPPAKDRTTRALDEGTPPPLPPKTPSKFSFRSASSILPLGSRSRKAARSSAASPQDFHHNSGHAQRSPSPDEHLRNKPSKVFGASVQYDSTGDDTERKLTTLRDMGFGDVHRNLTVLKGVNGSLERAIETLVRLGEGDRSTLSATSAPAARHPLRASRSLTPVAPNTAPLPQHPTFQQEQPNTPSTVSSNPFDLLPPAQPQTAQSTGTLQNKNPYYPSPVSNNPYGSPLQQNDIAQAFNNLSLAPPQPLFPNHTGGIPSTQPGANQQQAYLLQQQQQQQMLLQQQQQQQHQQMSQNYAPMTFNSNMTYPQPSQQGLQPQQTGMNPFLASPQPQQPLAVNTMTGSPGGMGASNPFARSPTRIQSPPLGQISEQVQTNFYNSPQPLSPSAGNPFFAQQQQQQQPAQQLHQTQTWPMQQQQQPQQQQSLNPYQTQNTPQAQNSYQAQNPYQNQSPYQTQNPYLTQQTQPQSAYQSHNPFQSQQAPQQQQYHPPRADKASIMALYGQAPPVAALAPEQPQQQPGSPQNQTAQPAIGAQSQQPQRSASTPLLSGSKNPFMLNGGGAPTQAPAEQPQPQAQQQQQQQKSHASRESMAFNDMGWTNGRHSPDAFASLSSRHM
ncbi:putative GTPase activating protein for Arf-domain-containing protein [Plectosphaerella cucumerina]|uniref:GTPase activating protein for Arf-domain-containing protein n=1 Tax=Plectosphaerella cucumerina TaxID=40658 RepID=A0A8K0T9X8_9PEZI|nr:putative GTPase activating protein for Arf-domain-containing protein [Plectosphaerella cucumerina]